MRPKERQPPLLRVTKIVQLVDSAQHGARHDLAQSEVSFPARRLDGCIVIQALDGVCSRVRDLAFDGHHPIIPKPHDNVALPVSKDALTAKLTGGGCMRNGLDRSRWHFHEAKLPEGRLDHFFLLVFPQCAASSLRPASCHKGSRGQNSGVALRLGRLAPLHHPGEPAAVENLPYNANQPLHEFRRPLQGAAGK